jgi:hypothetical protein
MSKPKDLGKIKTELFEVKLFVKGEEVANSRDVRLWQEVLEAINEGESEITKHKGTEFVNKKVQNNEEQGEFKDKEGLVVFSKAIDINKVELEGACGPSKQPPYIHLDDQYWEALKRNTPERGRGSISSSVLSATLITLWFKYAKLGQPLIDDAANVEKTIHLEDVNIMRSIRKCKWLQIRNEKLTINPAEISRALMVCKAYCTKKPIEKPDKQ